MIELYKDLPYSHKKDVCDTIADKLKKQPNSVRNWFISKKKIPEKYENLVLNELELEKIRANIKFVKDPEILFEMNRKYRELSKK